MKLDKNYNFVIDDDRAYYADEFNDAINLIAQAKDSGKINEREARLLLSLLIQKQARTDLSHFAKSLFATSKKSERNAIFIHLKTSKTNYA